MIIKHDEEEEDSQFEIISTKLQILNLNETDKNSVELVKTDTQIEIKCENILNSKDFDEPFLKSSMNCVLEIKYTNKFAHSQYLCRTMRKNFTVKFFQIIVLTDLTITDLK